MSDKYSVRILQPDEYEAWNRMNATSPSGSIYARPEYLEVLCSATGGKFEIHGVFRKGALVGGLPLYRQTGRAGIVATNRLLLYYNGIVVSETESRAPGKQQSLNIGIHSALSEHVKALNFDSVTIHSRLLDDTRVFRSTGWQVRPHYTLTIDLENIDACWNRIDHNLQRLIRRSESSGVSVAEESDFDEFYRQHSQLCQKKHLPVYLPQKSFKKYYERLSEIDLCKMFHARLKDGRSIASLLTLADQHPTTHTVVATSDDDFHDVGASAQIRWESFKYFSEHGYRENDLTDASLNSVTRFKSQLGGRLQQNIVLTLPDSRKYRFYKTLNSLLGKLRGR